MTEATLTMILLAPAIAAVALLVALIAAEICHCRQETYTCNLIEECISKQGYDKTMTLLKNAKQAGLSHRATVLLLEKFLLNQNN